jgi:hypothetical protein
MAISNRVEFCSYSITLSDQDPQFPGLNVGKVVTRSPGEITCAFHSLLDISCFSIVPDTGNITLRIKSLLCSDDHSYSYLPPPNIVATPFSATPIFTTVKHSLILGQSNVFVDLEIQIFAWQDNGAPAPHVTVDWRCRVPVYKVLQ